MGPLVNPYAKPRQAVPVVAHNAANMGRQSQHHVANQHKRKFKLCDNSNTKRRKGDQLTLQGNVAFNPEVDCKVCKAKHIHKFIIPGYPIPKRAASSSKNPWRLSDHDRHVREMQSVKCTGIFCQDHTFQVCKNYRKKLGAVAAWDVPTGTGEIASAVLVRSTRTEDFAHAAQQMAK